MVNVSFNPGSVVKLNDTEKQPLNNVKKDDFNDNVIHVGEDGKVNKEDLLGALKDGNKEVFIKKPDGTVYKANVEQELNKLNEGLTKNEDLCIDFCVTETKTETKDLPPNMEEANKFKFKLSDGKDTKKELKEMGVNVKDGLDKKEVETIVNKLRTEGATQPEIDNFLKDVNKLRGMKKNDQTLDIKTGENKVDYSVEDNTVKKGPREKVRNGEFKLPGINVEKVRDGEVKLPTVNVEKVRDGEVKLPTVNVEKEGKFEFKLPKLNIDYKKGDKEEIRKLNSSIRSIKNMEKGNIKEQDEKINNAEGELKVLEKNGGVKDLEKQKSKYQTQINDHKVNLEREKSKVPPCDDTIKKLENTISNLETKIKSIDNTISQINSKKEEIQNLKNGKENIKNETDCDNKTSKDKIKEIRNEIRENRGKLTIDPEKGKLDLPKLKINTEPGKLQLPKFKVEGEPGKLQLPKFKVEGEPGKLQLPKYERPKIKEEGFSGSVKTKEDITTTKTDCETIGVDKTPEKPKSFDLSANNNYENNWVTNKENFFNTPAANQKVTGQDYTYKEATLQAFNAGASIEIKCSGDKNNLTKHGLSSDAVRIGYGKNDQGEKTQIFKDNKGNKVELTEEELKLDRQSNLDYNNTTNTLEIESSASIAQGSDVKYDNLKFESIGTKGAVLKEYFETGAKADNTNTYLSVGRGLEMSKDIVETAFQEFKANNPGKGKEEFLEAFGKKEIKLTKGHDDIVLPNLPEPLNVADIMALYDIK